MKNLKEILESQNFLVNKKLNNRQDKYDYHPNSPEELIDIIIKLLNKGITNLNCIDVTKVTDMWGLFNGINKKFKVKNIDISKWDVSNVEDMRAMFYECKEFTADMSNWNVSNVEHMGSMFKGCEKFNSDLSKWDVSKVKDMGSMFYKCEKFNSDLSKWNVSNVKDMWTMFFGCTTLEKNNKIPDWYSN